MQKFCFIILIAGVLSGCASGISVRADDRGLQSVAEAYFAEYPREFANDMEKRIVEESAYYLMGYLQKRYGEPWFGAFTNRILQGMPIPEAVRRTYGMTVYAVSYEMLKTFEQPGECPAGAVESTNIGIFRIEYNAGSPAERDLPKIAYLLTDYFDRITNFFLTNGEARETFASTLSNFRDGRVFIRLYNDKRQYGQASVASTTVGYNARPGDTGFVPVIGFATAYYNVLSIYAFSHELAHVVMALSRVDFPVTVIPFEDETLSEVTNPTEFGRRAQEEVRRRMPELMDKTKKFDGFVGGQWGEGLAEYLTARANIYYRYGLFGDVDDELAFLLERGRRMTPVAKLLDGGLRGTPSIAKIMQHYQQMHSCVEYIVERYGWGAMYRLIDSGSTDADFERILGVNRGQFQREWLERLERREAE